MIPPPIPPSLALISRWVNKLSNCSELSLCEIIPGLLASFASSLGKRTLWKISAISVTLFFSAVDRVGGINRLSKVEPRGAGLIPYGI